MLISATTSASFLRDQETWRPPRHNSKRLCNSLLPTRSLARTWMRFARNAASSEPTGRILEAAGLIPAREWHCYGAVRRTRGGSRIVVTVPAKLPWPKRGGGHGLTVEANLRCSV